MKPLCWIALVLLAIVGPAVKAQINFSVDWSTIDGGGGTSTGGVYSVNGTIGQPDAGKMSGGSYSIESGYWGMLAAVQTPNAPSLTIFRTDTNTVAVVWAAASPGWKLQENGISVNSPTWSNVATAIQDDGTTRTYIINSPTGNRYYRLWKP